MRQNLCSPVSLTYIIRYKFHVFQYTLIKENIGRDILIKKRILSVIITCFLLVISSNNYYHKLNNLLIIEKEQLSVADPQTRENEYTIYLDSNKNRINEPIVSEEENIQLNALSAALVDGESGRVLYEKDGYTRMAMASTTKIMTCIIALENSNPEDIVTVSKYASTMPDVQLHIRENEQYYMRDMLYALMLESCNDVAVAIAEHVGGSAEGFAKMMNQKAKELGCTDTNFVTSNGLDADSHYTTAVEIAIISTYAIKNPDFVEITNQPNWNFSELTKGRTFMVSNKDKFLYMYDGAIGIKTGFTNNAGYCFVGAVKQNGNTYVSSVLGSGWPPNRNYKWKDTSKLMDYGVNNFKKIDIFYQHIFTPIFIDNGKEKISTLTYSGEIPLLISENDYIKIIYYMPEKLQAPVDKNTIIGKALYYVNEQLIMEIPILTTESVAEIDYEYCLEKMISLWLNEIY